MTKLNLNETSLLAVSGELDAGGQRRLEEYFIRHPHARTQFERLKGDLDLLRSLPAVELSDPEKLRYAGNIKRGLHEKLRQQQKQEAAAKRRRFIYSALASISAAAAAVVITAGVMMVDQSIHQKRQQAKADSINEIVTRLSTYQEQPNQYDETLQDVANSIHELQTQSPSVAVIQGNDMATLIDALATEPNDADTPAPLPAGSY